MDNFVHTEEPVFLWIRTVEPRLTSFRADLSQNEHPVVKPAWPFGLTFTSAPKSKDSACWQTVPPELALIPLIPFADDRLRVPMGPDTARNEAEYVKHHCHIPSRQSSRQPICGLDEACLTGDRLRLDRLPATTRHRFLTPEGCALLLSH